MRKQVLSILKEIDAVHAEKYELVKKWESAASERDQWRAYAEKLRGALGGVREEIMLEYGDTHSVVVEAALQLPRPGSSE